MHDILLLRNFHDLHAGDIPFVTVDWSDDTVQRVLDYYVALSKPDHDADALKRECSSSACHPADGGRSRRCSFHARAAHP